MVSGFARAHAYICRALLPSNSRVLETVAPSERDDRLADRCNCFTCRETVAPSVIGLQVREGFVLPTDSYKHPQWSTGQDLGSGISEQCDDTHTPRPFIPLLRDVIMDSDFYVPDVANSRPVAGCARVNGFCQDFCQRKLPSGCLDALPCVL